MPFAQLAIGPPGSGKSTYCDGMHQFMAAIERKCSVVNLDPANDATNYPAALDVRDLVTLEEIMEDESLGPNGGILYAMEELEKNISWLEDGLKKLGDNYVIFDCPGQAELFTHHASLRNIFHRLSKIGYRLVVIHLVDSISLTRPSLYISTLLLSLRSMLQLDLPHLNVLTKIDTLNTYDPLPLPLSFYTDVQSTDYLLPFLDAEQRGEQIGPILDSVPTAADAALAEEDDSEENGDGQPESRFSALNKAILDLVDQFGLVGYETLAVEDRQSMAQLLHSIDRASGYAFGGTQGANESVWQTAVREGGGAGFMDVRDVEERWIDRREEFDEMDRQQWKEEAEHDKRQEAQNKQKPRREDDAGANSMDFDPEELRAAQSGATRVVRKAPSKS